MRRALCLIALLVAVGCTNIKYIGDSYPPTTHVDVYFDERDVEQDFRVIGHADATAPDYVNTEDMMKKLKEKAMEKGAHAIIVLGFDRNVVGESTRWENKTETDDDDNVKESGYSTTSTEKENEIRVIFIRYKTPSDTKMKAAPADSTMKEPKNE